jgi:hypothetical protein
VTLLPMLFVTSTTLTAGAQMLPQFVKKTQDGDWSVLKGVLNVGLMLFVILCVAALLFQAAARWVAVLRGVVPVRPERAGVGAAGPAEAVTAQPAWGVGGGAAPHPNPLP